MEQLLLSPNFSLFKYDIYDVKQTGNKNTKVRITRHLKYVY